jgi:hypothetical protein
MRKTGIFPQIYDGWEITEVYGINARPEHKGTLEEMVPFLHDKYQK